ncbi:MAG: hypothetical protein HON83_01520 [Candidatus Marinimicrobia bacterium]|jgi:hypothetical protein|nr:hypothetical protein [Candidatus Scalindua sp.]MBT3354677.1 hypothetical protein [Candidatus Scalindua sp.]MBT4795088.1 hypothetical protein [Candidatus Neomarinimicrobiota bacterium]
MNKKAMIKKAVRVLKLGNGNGNQHRNKKIAMKFIISHFDATMINHKTVEIPELGSCHVAAYTSDQGAMMD